MKEFLVVCRTTLIIRGSIILSFGVESITSEQFQKLESYFENDCSDVCGLGLATAGVEDALIEDTDEYRVRFKKWVTLNSEPSQITIKDTASISPLPTAVYCQSLTKVGVCCKNKTKDPSKRCWRHRG